VTAQLASFAGITWPPGVIKALTAAQISQPSPIQAIGIPVMLTGANAILHSPTGSGKTLSYLLPIVARIAATEMPAPRQALVVVPSRELALQVLGEAISLQVVLQVGVYLVSCVAEGVVDDDANGGDQEDGDRLVIGMVMVLTTVLVMVMVMVLVVVVVVV